MVVVNRPCKIYVAGGAVFSQSPFFSDFVREKKVHVYVLYEFHFFAFKEMVIIK